MRSATYQYRHYHDLVDYNEEVVDAEVVPNEVRDRARLIAPLKSTGLGGLRTPFTFVLR